MLIEISIILTGAKFPVFLLHKEEGGCLRGVEKADFSSCQVFLKEVLGSFLFVQGEQVDFAYFRDK